MQCCSTQSQDWERLLRVCEGDGTWSWTGASIKMMESIAQRGKEVTNPSASHCFFYEKRPAALKNSHLTTAQRHRILFAR